MQSPTSPQQDQQSQQHSQSLETLLQHLTLQGWRLHNLYQGENKWEARIKLVSSSLVYGYGEGLTPSDALTAALEHGEARKNWRPYKPAIVDSPRRSANTPCHIQDQRSVTTTDDLMGGLDL